MKKTKLKSIIFLFALSLISFSCQNEAVEEVINTPEENIVEGSELFAQLRTTFETDNNNTADCIDFEYPINFLVYDANWQITETISAANSDDILAIMDLINENFSVGLDYPVNLIYQDTIITTNSNEELLNALNEYGVCNDYDYLFECVYEGFTVDFVYVDNDSDPTDGITEIELPDAYYCNDTIYYMSYYLSSQDAENQTNAIWDGSNSNELYTNISNPQTLYAIGQTDFEGANLTSSVFEVNITVVPGDYENEDCPASYVEQNISSYELWHISDDNFFDSSIDINNYNIHFSSDGTLQISYTFSDEIIYGSWDVYGDAQSGSTLAEFDLGPDLQQIDGTWTVSNCSLGENFYLTFTQGDQMFELTPGYYEGNDSNSIIGRWHPLLYDDSTLYEFSSDGYKYTIYSNNGVFGGIEDAIPNPNQYFYNSDEEVLSIDFGFGNQVDYILDFKCDANVVDFYLLDMNAGSVSFHSTLYKEGYNYDNCDE
jgi:hypothetical protein